MDRSKSERGDKPLASAAGAMSMGLEQVRQEALLWRLSGVPSEWNLELHRLEQALDALALPVLESRSSPVRLEQWRRRQGDRARLQPELRLDLLLTQVSTLMALGFQDDAGTDADVSPLLPRALEQWGAHVRTRENPSDAAMGSTPTTLVTSPVRRMTEAGPERPLGRATERTEHASEARGRDGGAGPRLEPLPLRQSRAGERHLEPHPAIVDVPHFEPPPIIGLELALDLLPWVLGREVEIHNLLNRLRQNIYKETGVRVPVISISDSGTLAPGSYRLELRGETVTVGRLRGLECMVLDATPGMFEGTPGHEPAFGMPGLWIAPSLKDVARSEGLTVLTPVDMFLAHITEVMRTRIHEIYGATQLSHDLHLIENRLPGMMTQLRHQPGEGQLLRVFRLLLEEGLSIRDLDTIFESLLEHSRDSLSAEAMTSRVRRSLKRHISARFVDDDGTLHTFVLTGELESRLLEHQRDESPLLLPAEIRSRLMRSVQQQLERWNQPVPPVLVCPDLLRFTIRRTLSSLIRVLPVLAVSELAADVKIHHCGELTLMHSVG